MKTVVCDQHERVLAWVGEQVDAVNFFPGAVGIGLEEDGELIAGVVFELYNEVSVHMHVAISKPITRQRIGVAFAYPFIQLNCERITGLIRADNVYAQRFAEHLGFVREGRMRRACKDGTDMLVYGMLRDECRWIGVRQ